MDPPAPEGCLEAALQAGGLHGSVLSNAPPPNASQRAGAFLPTAVVAALLCIDVVKGEGSRESQEHKHGGA